MEDHLWLLWVCLGDVFMGCGISITLGTQSEPSVCIFVEDDPIVHTMVYVERENYGFDDCKKKRGCWSSSFILNTFSIG